MRMRGRSARKPNKNEQYEGPRQRGKRVGRKPFSSDSRCQRIGFPLKPILINYPDFTKSALIWIIHRKRRSNYCASLMWGFQQLEGQALAAKTMFQSAQRSILRARHEAALDVARIRE